MTKQTNQKVQALRALSIIAVVMIHTCPKAEWQVFCRPFINFAVATFIFLSGYLTNLEIDKPLKFCAKRISRVLFPYIIWSIIYTIFEDGLNLRLILVGLVTAQTTWHLYFIQVYVQFVILTPLLVKLVKCRYMWGGFCIAPLSIVAFKYLPLLGLYEFNPYLNLLWSDSCLGWFTFYYLGLLLGNGIIAKRYSIHRLSWIYAFVIVLAMAEGYWWLMLGSNDCGTQLKLSSLLTSSVFILMGYTYLHNNRYTQPQNTFLLSLGNYSFGIYLIHILLILQLRNYTFYQFIPFPINSALVLIASWATIYLAAKVLPNSISRCIGLR